jgi:hypothetical protein
LGKSAVAFVYAGVFLRDVISGWGYPSLDVALLGVGVFLALVTLFTNGITERSMRAEGFGFALANFILWTIILGLTQKLNTSSYFIAPLLAFLVINTAPKAFFTLLIANLILTVSVQLGEYLTNSYLFVYETLEGELDEKFFGGSLQVFRAKGFFQGPLSAVAFATWMAFFFRGSIIFAALMLLSAFLAAGRLGMVAASILLLIRTVKPGEGLGSNRVLIGAFFISTMLLLIPFVDEDRLLFITSAFDSESGQNLGRSYFWLASINYFVNYDWLNILFGKFGFIRAEIGGTENDFLRILLDNGAIHFLIYVVGLLWVLRASKYQRGIESIVVFVLIIGMMNLYPFIQSLSSSLLFWMFVFGQPRALRVLASRERHLCPRSIRR